MNVHAYRDDILTVEKVSFAELVEVYGSPLYVYSKKSIHDEIQHVEQGFEGMPHTTYYAVKANANHHLLRLIASEGLGADVGSRGELFLALRAGFPPSKITFSGVGKRDDEILYALGQHVHAFYVESTQEIEVLNTLAGQVGVRARILLRVNLDIDAGGHEYVSTSLRHNKFGLPHTQAVDVLKNASLLPNIEVCGIHSHVGSQITKAAVFVKAAEAVARIIQKVREAGVPVQELDFGGGFGIQYHGYINHRGLPVEHAEEAHLSTTALVRASLPILRTTGCALSIQPGRCIVAYAGVLLTRVIYRKETEGRTFLIVDGAMTDLIRPSLYHAHHQIVPVRLAGAPYEAVDVVGPVCESGDFFAHDRRLPRMDRGDLLALMCAGAYGYAQSSTYNARPRPAEILVDGANHTVIRPRETLEQL